MTREGHVRFCQRMGVRFPRATRQMVVRIAGERMYLWRAVDHEGEVLDMLVQRRRDTPGKHCRLGPEPVSGSDFRALCPIGNAQ